MRRDDFYILFFPPYITLLSFEAGKNFNSPTSIVRSILINKQTRVELYSQRGLGLLLPRQLMIREYVPDPLGVGNSTGYGTRRVHVACRGNSRRNNCQSIFEFFLGERYRMDGVQTGSSRLQNNIFRAADTLQDRVIPGSTGVSGCSVCQNPGLGS
jgi:hypothetical protein